MPIFKPTLSSLTADFRKLGEQLRELSVEKGKSIDENNVKIASLQAENDAHRADGDKATKIAQNIEKLLGE